MYRALVIGLGSFGSALVKELMTKGETEVIVVESDHEKAQQFKDLVSQVIVGDATKREVLVEFGKDVDCAIVCLGERIDSSVLITYCLKEIGVKRIIAKATTEDHAKILSVVGADEVISPESDTAKRLAASLVSPGIVDFVKLSEDFNIIEIAVPDKFVKKTIKELQLRSEYGIQVLAIKNALMGESQVMPSPDYELKPDDVLIVLGGADALKKVRF